MGAGKGTNKRVNKTSTKPNSLMVAFGSSFPEIDYVKWIEFVEKNELENTTWLDYYLPNANKRKPNTDKNISYVLTELFRDLLDQKLITSPLRFRPNITNEDMLLNSALKKINYNDYKIDYTQIKYVAGKPNINGGPKLIDITTGETISEYVGIRIDVNLNEPLSAESHNIDNPLNAVRILFERAMGN